MASIIEREPERAGGPADVRPKIRLMEERTRGMSEGEVKAFCFNAEVVYTNVAVTAMTLSSPEAQEIIDRLGYRRDLGRDMEVAAEVLLELTREKHRIQHESPLRADWPRAAELKRRLMGEVKHKAIFGFVSDKALASLSDKKTKSEVAAFLSCAVSILVQLPPEARRHVLCSDEELVEAKALSQKLLLASQQGSPAAAASKAEASKRSNLINRTWTLLSRLQNQAERVAMVLFGRDWGEHCPPLTSREQKRRTAEAKSRPAEGQVSADAAEPAATEGAPAHGAPIRSHVQSGARAKVVAAASGGDGSAGSGSPSLDVRWSPSVPA
jgi:hypothetical protein